MKTLKFGIQRWMAVCLFIGMSSPGAFADHDDSDLIPMGDQGIQDQVAAVDYEFVARHLSKMSQDLGASRIDFTDPRAANFFLDEVTKGKEGNDVLEFMLLDPVAAIIGDVGEYCHLERTGEWVGEGIRKIGHLVDQKLTGRKEKKKILLAFERAMREYAAIRKSLVGTEAQVRGFLHVMELVRTMDQGGGRSTLIDQLDAVARQQLNRSMAIDRKVTDAYVQMDKNQILENSMGEKDLNRVSSRLRRLSERSTEFVKILKNSSDKQVCADLVIGMHNMTVLENDYQHATNTLLDTDAIYIWVTAMREFHQRDAKHATKVDMKKVSKRTHKLFELERRDVELDYQRNIALNRPLLEQTRRFMDACLMENTHVPTSYLRRFKRVVGAEMWDSCLEDVTHGTFKEAAESPDYLEGIKKLNEKRIRLLVQIERAEQEFAYQPTIPDEGIYQMMMASYLERLGDANQRQGQEGADARLEELQKLKGDIDRVCAGIQEGT